MWINDKYHQIKDSIKIANAFKRDKRCVEIQVIKGNRKIQKAIYDSSKCCFFILKEVITILHSDLIVDDRNQLFKVIKVEENSNVEIEIDNEKQTISVTAIYCETYHIDNSLFDVVNSQQQTIYQVLNVNIGSIDNSNIDTIGSANISNHLKQNIVNKWETIKRELGWRFDYRDHEKYIKSVDSAISQNDPKMIDIKAKEKTMKLLGGFLGELIGVFTTCLIDYFSNK